MKIYLSKGNTNANPIKVNFDKNTIYIRKDGTIKLYRPYFFGHNINKWIEL